MDDNYFDKKLKDILETPPEFRVDQTAISDMQSRLRNAGQKKKRTVSPLLLIPLALIPLLIGGAFFFYQQQQLEHKISQLDQQLNQISHTTHRDTIVQKQVIYQFDTIYKVIYQPVYPSAEELEQKLVAMMAKQQTNGQKWNSTYSGPTTLMNNYNWGLGNNSFSLLNKTPGSSIFDNGIFSFPSKEASSYKLTEFPWMDRILSYAQSLKDLGHPDLLVDQEFDLPEPPEGKIPPHYYVTPTGFKVGASGSPIVLPINDYSSSANAYGLAAEIEFPQNRSMRIGLEMVNLNFEIKDVNQFANFPTSNPNDPTDVLHELKGNFRYLQIPVSLQQRFRANHKFQPSFSAGIVATRPIRQAFTYEYLTGFDEYKLNTTFKNGAFSFDNLRLALGATYFFNDKLSAESSVQYQHAFSQSPDEYLKLRYWGLQVGLNYKIN